MVSLQTLLLAVTVAAPDATLLDFYSPACGPCRSMVPTISRLEQAGYAVRKVDVGKETSLAQQYGVRAVPCFVLVSKGRVVDRVEGPTSFERLRQMYAKAGVEPASATTNVQAQGPAAQGSPNAGDRPLMRFRGQSPDDMPSKASSGNGNQPPHVQAAYEATVRLRVDDAQGQSWGTGTIVDVHGDEALVVTCGHIFRDSAGKGKIRVELFAPGAREPVAGELIAYDADDRDIGLVSIRPNVPVRAARVAPPTFRSFRGDRVFSIGCNHGEDPTVRHSRVAAINKYLGPPNVEVEGQPVDGRSGGGLFASDGSLIGVCNAADPEDNEGIYAALETIQWQLREVGQERIFLAASAGRRSGTYGETASAGRTMPAGVAMTTRGASSSGAAAGDDDVEVICIVRRRGQPKQQVIVLDEISPSLLNQIMLASQRQIEEATGTGMPGQPARPIIRAQSQDNHPAYQRAGSRSPNRR